MNMQKNNGASHEPWGTRDVAMNWVELYQLQAEEKPQV